MPVVRYGEGGARLCIPLALGMLRTHGRGGGR